MPQHLAGHAPGAGVQFSSDGSKAKVSMKHTRQSCNRFSKVSGFCHFGAFKSSKHVEQKQHNTGCLWVQVLSQHGCDRHWISGLAFAALLGPKTSGGTQAG